MQYVLQVYKLLSNDGYCWQKYFVIKFTGVQCTTDRLPRASLGSPISEITKLQRMICMRQRTRNAIIYIDMSSTPFR